MRDYLGSDKTYPAGIVKLAADTSDDAAFVLVDWLEENDRIRPTDRRLRPAHDAGEHELASWRAYVDLVRGAILGRPVERDRLPTISTVIADGDSLFFGGTIAASPTGGTRSGDVRFELKGVNTVHENLFFAAKTRIVPPDYPCMPVPREFAVTIAGNAKTWRCSGRSWAWERRPFPHPFENRWTWNVILVGSTSGFAGFR
jgi:hypothetical protein